MNGSALQGALLVSIVAVLVSSSTANGLNEPTHELINAQAVGNSSLNQVLRDHLGVSEGVDRLFRARNETHSVLRWIELGGTREDAGTLGGNITGTNRYFRHFHDPLLPWDRSGLLHPLILPPRFTRFESSVHWAQLENQDSISSFGNFSWRDARRYFRTALTDPAPAIREQAFADTFRALGQIMHLIVDASVPEHVRNDIHPMGEVLDRLGLVGNYEYWVLAQHRNSGTQPGFIRDFLSTPMDPDEEILRIPIPDSESVAQVPIARLFDSDRYTGDNPEVTAESRIGIAEIANANFFSEDTHRGEYPYPALANLETFTRIYSQNGQERTYYRKRVAGLAVEPIAAECPLADPTQTVSLCPDEDVWRETARHMLPRAVRYSRAFLDYFFRGKLDVDLVEDLEDPSLLRLVGTNRSEEPLVDGTLKLYADNPEGQRVEAGALDSTTISNVAKDQPLPTLRFQAPEGTERFVAVYEGTLGEEKKDPTRNFPGAVIGKVLGGVRVEEIFNDGSRWKMRTPTGVFFLPLTVAEFDEVKWGDPDDHLVARTPMGPNRPNRVAAYRLLRQEGTVEPETEATPQGPEVRLLKLSEATFPFGLQLGTTVHYTDTLSYRQQMVTLDRTDVYTFINTDPERPLVGEYRFDRSEFGDVNVRTVASQTFTFEESFPLVLDEAQLTFSLPGFFPTFGSVPGDRVSYHWAIADVALNAAGHLLALVGVGPAYPVDGPILEPTLLGLDEKGELVPRKYCSSSNPSVCFTTVRIDPGFPGFGDGGASPLLWALVDLTEGKLLHSTAGPAITITASETQEAPAWTVAGHPEALVYVNLTVRRVGGASPGEERQVLGQSLMKISSSPVQSLTTLTFQGPGSLTVTGWHQPALQDALDRAGFVLGSPEDVETLGGDEVAIWEIGPGIRLRLVTDTATFSVPPQFHQARRARPASEGERLVFAAHGHTSVLTKTHGVLSWDPGSNRAEVGLVLPGVPLEASNFSILGAATRNAVLLHRPFEARQGAVLVPLVDGSNVTVFDDVGGLRDFTLLDPNFLYNFKIGKFFRLTPPLQATTLPAKLAEPGDPAGDYHVVRIK